MSAKGRYRLTKAVELDSDFFPGGNHGVLETIYVDDDRHGPFEFYLYCAEFEPVYQSNDEIKRITNYINTVFMQDINYL